MFFKDTVYKNTNFIFSLQNKNNLRTFKNKPEPDRYCRLKHCFSSPKVLATDLAIPFVRSFLSSQEISEMALEGILMITDIYPSSETIWTDYE